MFLHTPCLGDDGSLPDHTVYASTIWLRWHLLLDHHPVARRGAIQSVSIKHSHGDSRKIRVRLVIQSVIIATPEEYVFVGCYSATLCSTESAAIDYFGRVCGVFHCPFPSSFSPFVSDHGGTATTPPSRC